MGAFTIPQIKALKLLQEGRELAVNFGRWQATAMPAEIGFSAIRRLQVNWSTVRSLMRHGLIEEYSSGYGPRFRLTQEGKELKL